MPRWKEPTKGNQRWSQDDIKREVAVPVWATPERHTSTYDDVYLWKSTFPLITASISGYFREGPGGAEFLAGMEELWSHFEWQRSIGPATDMTHKKFFYILLKMRDAYNDEDQPSSDDIRRGQEAFAKKIANQQVNFECQLRTSAATAATGIAEEDKISSGGKRGREDTLKGDKASSNGNKRRNRPSGMSGQKRKPN